MECLVVEFRIHPQHAAAFDAAIRDNARASLEDEPACRQFDVCRDPADDGLFFLYELYDDDAGVQAHLNAPHFLEMSRVTADWVASKTIRRLRRTSP